MLFETFVTSILVKLIHHSDLYLHLSLLRSKIQKIKSWTTLSVRASGQKIKIKQKQLTSQPLLGQYFPLISLERLLENRKKLLVFKRHLGEIGTVASFQWNWEHNLSGRDQDRWNDSPFRICFKGQLQVSHLLFIFFIFIVSCDKEIELQPVPHNDKVKFGAEKNFNL